MSVVVRGSWKTFTRGEMLRSRGENFHYDAPQSLAHYVEFAGVFAKGRYDNGFQCNCYCLGHGSGS